MFVHRYVNVLDLCSVDQRCFSQRSITLQRFPSHRGKCETFRQWHLISVVCSKAGQVLVKFILSQYVLFDERKTVIISELKTYKAW